MNTPAATDRRYFGGRDDTRSYDERANNDGSGPRSVFSGPSKGQSGVGRRGAEQVVDIQTLKAQTANRLQAFTVDRLDDYRARAHAAQSSQIPLGIGQFHTVLNEAVAGVARGESATIHAAEVAKHAPGFTLAHLNRVIARVGTLIGQAVKTAAPSAAPVGQLNLGIVFDDEALAVTSGANPALAQVQSLSADAIAVAVWVWLARERARQFQQRRLVELEDLLYLQRAWEADVPVEVILGSRHFAHAPQRLLAAAEILYEETLIGVFAWEEFLPGLLAQGQTEMSTILASGVVAFVDPALANKLATRAEFQGSVDIDWLLRQPVEITRSPEGLDAGRVLAIVRRRGLRDSGVEQPTWDERSLRHLRGLSGAAEAIRYAAHMGGFTEAEVLANPSLLVDKGARVAAQIKAAARRSEFALDDITVESMNDLINHVAACQYELTLYLYPWVRDGDASLLVENMIDQRSREAETSWVFKVDDHALAVQNRWAVEGAAHQAMGGRPYTVVTPEQVLFETKPEIIIKDITRLAVELLV